MIKFRTARGREAEALREVAEPHRGSLRPLSKMLQYHVKIYSVAFSQKVVHNVKI